MERHPGMKYMSGMQKFFLKKSVKAMNEHITYEGEDYTGRMLEIYYIMIRALRNISFIYPDERFLVKRPVNIQQCIQLLQAPEYCIEPIHLYEQLLLHLKRHLLPHLLN